MISFESGPALQLYTFLGRMDARFRKSFRKIETIYIPNSWSQKSLNTSSQLDTNTVQHICVPLHAQHCAAQGHSVRPTSGTWRSFPASSFRPDLKRLALSEEKRLKRWEKIAFQSEKRILSLAKPQLRIPHDLGQPSGGRLSAMAQKKQCRASFPQEASYQLM